MRFVDWTAMTNGGSGGNSAYPGTAVEVLAVAAAAEELSAQAETMQEAVGELLVLVNGRSETGTPGIRAGRGAEPGADFALRPERSRTLPVASE